MSTDAKATPALSPRRILIVEDSEFVHQIYRVAFRKFGGCHLLHASDGLQGLQLLDEGPVDLIILDLNMPVMDGLAFIRQLKTRPRHAHTHVLVVSTEDRNGKIREAILEGASSFLQKPFNLEQLLELLERVMKTLPERRTP